MIRNFIFLAVLTVLALLVVMLFASGEKSTGTPVKRQLLLPGISQQINDVNRVDIITAGNETLATLLRGDAGWQLEQMDGYRADWPKIRVLLTALAQARVIENKTDKPEYYTRLGVEDVAGENAGSVLVRLTIGDQTAAVLVGHRAEGRQGQYVRLQGKAESVLVDRGIDVSTERLDWADSRIIDIAASEVAEVEIIHPGGERVLVTRMSADQTDFDLVGLPQDREIKSSWAVNSLGSVLSLLNMKSVRPADSVDWSDAIRMRLLTFSGLEIMAEMTMTGDEHLLRLSASHPVTAVTDTPADDPPATVEQQDLEKQAKEDVEKRVEDINRKVSGWVYEISKSKYDAMVKKPEDLLKPLETS